MVQQDCKQPPLLPVQLPAVLVADLHPGDHGQPSSHALRRHHNGCCVWWSVLRVYAQRPGGTLQEEPPLPRHARLFFDGLLSNSTDGLHLRVPVWGSPARHVHHPPRLSQAQEPQEQGGECGGPAGRGQEDPHGPLPQRVGDRARPQVHLVNSAGIILHT